MRSAKRRILGTLACATALAGVATVTGHNPFTAQSLVKAATNYASARSYGVDVSSFQSTNLGPHAQAGAQFAIVKVSEGTSYRNPNAAGQIASAKAHNMMPMSYHFATFSNNASAAAAEARYAISSARATGLPNGSYIVCDWETGDGNMVSGSAASNTNAILSFMNTVKSAGYQPMLYSGAYLLKNNINTSTILSRYPNSLWVASYATMGRIDQPDFNYFPSMDGIAIWQFTDNWRGLYVDGNISLLPLSYNHSTTQAPAAQKPAAKPQVTTTSSSNDLAKKQGQTTNSGSPVVQIAYPGPGKVAVWKHAGSGAGVNYLAQGTRWKVSYKTYVNGEWWYNLGGNQFVPSKYVYVTGFSSIPARNNANSSHTSISGTTTYHAVGQIHYVPGYGIMVWGQPGKNMLKRYLPHGSKWKIYKRATVNGHVWYNLGGNQWIDSTYVNIV